jgi:hypothetical protein
MLGVEGAQGLVLALAYRRRFGEKPWERYQTAAAMPSWQRQANLQTFLPQHEVDGSTQTTVCGCSYLWHQVIARAS